MDSHERLCHEYLDGIILLGHRLEDVGHLTQGIVQISSPNGRESNATQIELSSMLDAG